MSDATTGEREYPITYKNRTYIPLRSVATLLGMNVDYDDVTKTAIVNSKDYIETGDESNLYSNEEIIRILKQIRESEEHYRNNLDLEFDFGGVQRLVIEDMEKNDNFYTITARHDILYEITENEYDDMINTGKIVIDGYEFLYKNDTEMKYGNFSTESPYGYIKIENAPNEYINESHWLDNYTIIKSKNGYAFSCPVVGGGYSVIYKTENKVKFQVDGNTEVENVIGGSMGTLKDVNDHNIIGDTITYSDDKIIFEYDAR